MTEQEEEGEETHKHLCIRPDITYAFVDKYLATCTQFKASVQSATQCLSRPEILGSEVGNKA